MEFNKNEWIGNWINFESYIYSQEPAMKQCWADAEKIAVKMPMFKNGAKAFWQMACNTINETTGLRLGGWHIDATEDGMPSNGMMKIRNLSANIIMFYLR